MLQKGLTLFCVFFLSFYNNRKSAFVLNPFPLSLGYTKHQGLLHSVNPFVTLVRELCIVVFGLCSLLAAFFFTLTCFVEKNFNKKVLRDTF